MIKYNKIETVFNRDTEGTKKLIEGSYRNPAVEYLKDNTWVFTEKIDGTNIGIVWDGHNITYQGRTERAEIPKNLLSYLETTFGNSDTEELFEQMFGEKEVILFGEGYGGKIQAGGNYAPTERFILFDVMISGNYQPRETVEEISKSLGIDIVPILLKGTIQEAINFVKQKPKSTIGTAVMEGLVGKPEIELKDRCGNRLIIKVKVKDHTA